MNVRELVLNGPILELRRTGCADALVPVAAVEAFSQHLAVRAKDKPRPT